MNYFTCFFALVVLIFSNQSMAQLRCNQIYKQPTLVVDSKKEEMFYIYDGVLKGLEAYFGDSKIKDKRLELRKEISTLTLDETAQRYQSYLVTLTKEHNSTWLKNLTIELKKDPYNKDLENFVNRRQIGSKQFLVDGMKEAFGADLGPRVLIMGGWYGALANMIHDRGFRFGEITSYDIDPVSVEMSMRLNSHLVRENKFTSILKDVFEVDYSGQQPAVVINTSSEHMSHFKDWYAKLPKGTRVVIQSNDYFDLPGVPGRENGHCNCVANIEQLKLQAPMEKVLLEKTLPTDKYNRFMLIGIK
jgi:hypothetical protein